MSTSVTATVSMLPTAPDDRAWPSAEQLVEHVVGGIVSACVVCRVGCMTWLDVIGAGLAPVSDADGQLTDHACLHRRCVSHLLTHWASLVHHGGPGEENERDGTAEDHGQWPRTGADAPEALPGPAAPSSPGPREPTAPGPPVEGDGLGDGLGDERDDAEPTPVLTYAPLPPMGAYAQG